MSKELDPTKNEGGHPDLSRRQLGVGLLAVLGGGLGAVQTAQAFPSSAHGDFNAASHILDRYGIRVMGDDSSGHDVLKLETVPLPLTEYTQTVGTRNRLGAVDPCYKTSVFGDDVNFTHFHPGEILPCVKTSIIGHTLGTHELFDSDQGVDPCLRVESKMLEGGHIGTITATHFHPTGRGGLDPCLRTTIEGHSLATTEIINAGSSMPSLKLGAAMLNGGVIGAVVVTIDEPTLNLKVLVGGKTYNLVSGALELQRSPIS